MRLENMGATRTLEFVTASRFAERMLDIYNTENELSFATCFEVDGDGLLLDDSEGDWWGVKFIAPFDGACFLIGQHGGGQWYAYDATSEPSLAEVEDMVVNMFRAISAKEKVYVKRWV